MEKNNLVYSKITNNQDEEVVKNIRIATLNARSVRNKAHLIVQELHDSSVDMAVITEAWLKDTEVDNSWLNPSELKQCNYDILAQKRLGPKKGGGIALIYKHKYNNIKLLEKNTMTMEYIVCKLIHKNKPVHIIGIYHPPPSTSNQTTNATFIDKKLIF